MIGQGIAAKGINRDIKVIGVQTYCSPPWYYSFRDRKLNNDVEFRPTIAEGLGGLIEEPNITESFKCVDEIILVDEDTVRKAMAWMIDRHHMAAEMFAQSGSGEYDAVLMDIQMPVMNGYESAEAIRALEREDAKTVPIIAMEFFQDCVDQQIVERFAVGLQKQDTEQSLIFTDIVKEAFESIEKLML